MQIPWANLNVQAIALPQFLNLNILIFKFKTAQNSKIQNASNLILIFVSDIETFQSTIHSFILVLHYDNHEILRYIEKKH